MKIYKYFEAKIAMSFILGTLTNLILEGQNDKEKNCFAPL